MGKADKRGPVNVDVLVAGGGAAGVAAAITAARAGARTLLVDRQCMLGGMGSAALVHTICGLYQLRPQPGAVYAHPGFPTEFAERLIATGGATGPVRMGRLDVLPHHPAAFAQVADELAEGAGPNLEVWLHTELAAAHCEGGRLIAVDLLCCGSVLQVQSSQFIDASGDANLLALANVATEQADGRRLQRPGYITALQGVPPEALMDNARLKCSYTIAEAVKRGTLPPAALGFSLRGSIREGEAFMTIDLDGDESKAEDYEPTSPHCLAQVTIAGRRVAVQILACLERELPDFAAAWISQWPARPGIRESRRAVGRYQLRGDDLISSKTFTDGVAVSTWPIELREKNTGPKWRFPDSDIPSQIPLRALRSADLENVYVAGRCISCDHDAQAAIRVIGTCMATGEAVGLAATSQ